MTHQPDLAGWRSTRSFFRFVQNLVLASPKMWRLNQTFHSCWLVTKRPSGSCLRRTEWTTIVRANKMYEQERRTWINWTSLSEVQRRANTVCPSWPPPCSCSCCSACKAFEKDCKRPSADMIRIGFVVKDAVWRSFVFGYYWCCCFLYISGDCRVREGRETVMFKESVIKISCIYILWVFTSWVVIHLLQCSGFLPTPS